MTININGSLFTDALKACIEESAPSLSVFSDVQLYSGNFPNSVLQSISSDDLLNSQTINGSGIYTGTWINNASMPTSASGLGALSNYNKSSFWNSPSSGVITISQSVPIYIRNNAVINNKIPSFLRFYKIGVDVNYGRQAMFDISVSGIQEYRKAMLSSVDPVTNGISQVLSIKKLGFKIAVTGDVCFNNAFANCILQALCIKANDFSIRPSAQYNLGYHFGLPYCVNVSNARVSVPITISAYDGPIPDSANYEATGNLLWSSSYSSTTGVSIYEVSGNSFSLARTFTDNALMSGTPTYIRVVKSSYNHATDGTNFPRAVIQMPVGNSVNKANFTKLNFISGESISLESFTITLDIAET